MYLPYGEMVIGVMYLLFVIFNMDLKHQFVPFIFLEILSQSVIFWRELLFKLNLL